MASDSKVAFKSAVSELGLASLWDKFETAGWTTYSDFAFSTTDLSSKDGDAFEEELVKGTY